MRKNWLAILFLVLLASSVSRSIAQETKQITCTGRIVDSNAQPVGGAEVAAFEKFYDSSGQEYTKILGQVKKTDVNGCFALNADINSQRNVFIVARKKSMAIGWDVLNSGSSYNTKGNILIILEKPGTLAGIVVDETGNPVVGASVRALPKTSYLSRLRQRPILAPQQWFTTKTDAKGNFSFNNFAPDVSTDFWIEVPGKSSIYKYTPHSTSSCGFEVGRTDVRLVLPAEIKIQGRVVDKKNGESVPNIPVLIQPNNIKKHKNPYCPQENISGQDGRFMFKGLPAGKHRLKVFPTGKENAEWVGKFVEVDIQKDKAIKDITVEVEKGQRIKAIVREETTKKPLNNIQVSAYSKNAHGTAWTNTKGIAHIILPTGEYDVYASDPKYSYYQSNEPVIINKEQDTKLDILLNRKPGTSGIVLNESGQPAAGIIVRAHPFGDETLTDTEGRFEVSFDQSEPCKFLFARDVGRNLATVVEMKEDSGQIKATLKPALSIIGQITDSNGVGIPAARVSICAHMINCLSRFGSEVLTNSQGQYQIKAVPPQQEGFDYRISVNASGYGPKEYERVTISSVLGMPLEIKTIVLPPANQSISGIVVDANGVPAPGVILFVHGVDGVDQPYKSTATDENGRFAFKRICKGHVRIQVNFPNRPGGSGHLTAEAGNQDLRAVLGQDIVHLNYKSLNEKSLPKLKDLGIELSPEDLNTKMILACFFDMEQRPSRYCINQLAKQTDQLKKQGVTVVAIQASKIDDNKLNDWVKKYKIPFTIGAITADIEKTRFTWGVKSLPWLILTDPNHVVRAEGFSLTELEEKISAITQR